MIRYPSSTQPISFRCLLLKIGIGMFFVGLFAATGFAQLPDFHIDTNSITFSNPTPIEGEEVTISVQVKNIGDATPTMNEDLVVDLYEGDPTTKPLQIVCKDVILELKPGETQSVETRWQPPPGETEIYAVVNPRDAKYIEEADESNNIAYTTIVAQTQTFTPVTSEQVQNAVTKGINWIKAQQGRHSRTCLQCGTENQLILICITCQASLEGLAENFEPDAVWNFGEDQTQETALALQSLLATGHTPSHPSVKNGLEFLLAQDWNEFAVYQYAVIIPILVTVQDEAYRERAQFAINRLIEKQLPVPDDDFADPRDDGGWGYGFTADGAHMNMVIYALYAAKQWGLNIPADTWVRAEQWIRRNQTGTGGWLYNLVDDGSPWAIGVYGSMTATGLWALRACGVPVDDPQIRKGMAWIKRYWTLTRNPGSNSWLYYYLLSLQRFCDIPPTLNTLAGYNWYDEISQMMVSQQQPDGRWRGSESDFLATCFAVMTLSHALAGPTEPNIGIVPKSLRFSPPSPRVGEAVRLSTTLRNTGTSFDGILNIRFYVDNEEVGKTEVLWTPKLQETVVSTDWVPATDGEIELVASIDITDTDESDNTASEKITVYPQSTAATDPKLVKPEKISENIYKLGNVTLDTSKREITIPGEMNKKIRADSIIEFLACGKLGKTHESVLIVDAEPIHILTVLGALELDAGMNLSVEGDPRVPTGSPVEIWVEWNQGDKVISRRARELLWNTFKEQPMQETSWIFTGGRLINNQLTAQKFHNIIATYRDPDSIFNHPLPTGTDDRTYRVNTDVIPPKGTKIKLIIRPTTA